MDATSRRGGDGPSDSRSWTLRTRQWIDRALPMDHLLPDRHVSSVGRFFNSLHFWSVQMFFIFMVLHLWGQYFAAGWRDGRAATWLIGVVIFAASILTAFTGYLSQQNFDSQFIAINAKDAMNGAGIGAFFNVLNFGQMYGLHVMLLPIAVTFLVAWHIVLVRMRGVVKPIADEGASKS
jgi:quinol-cytochrome oxidoreductase complex cytochrome b subunit